MTSLAASAMTMRPGCRPARRAAAAMLAVSLAAPVAAQAQGVTSLPPAPALQRTSSLAAYNPTGWLIGLAAYHATQVGGLLSGLGWVGAATALSAGTISNMNRNQHSYWDLLPAAVGGFAGVAVGDYFSSLVTGYSPYALGAAAIGPTAPQVLIWAFSISGLGEVFAGGAVGATKSALHSAFPTQITVIPAPSVR